MTDAQDVATGLLYAEAKLGELLKETVSPGRPPKNVPSKEQLPEGISRKQSHYAQTLADNPEIIEEVIREAQAKEEIPTSLDRRQIGREEKIKISMALKG